MVAKRKTTPAVKKSSVRNKQAANAAKKPLDKAKKSQAKTAKVSVSKRVAKEGKALTTNKAKPKKATSTKATTSSPKAAIKKTVVAKQSTASAKTKKQLQEKTASKTKAVKATTKSVAAKKSVSKSSKGAKTAANPKVAAKRVPSKKVDAKAPAKKAVAKKTTAKKPIAKTPAKKAATKPKAAPKKVARKSAAVKTRAKTQTSSRVASNPGSLGNAGSDSTASFIPYVPKRNEPYMNDPQRAHFKSILLGWRNQLMEEVDRTVSHMKDEAANYPDPSDRASQEEEFSLELRTRDRERKLIRKIEKTIDLIDQDDYGYCETCGIEIGIRRLEARPTANQCIDCKTLDELKERQLHG